MNAPVAITRHWSKPLIVLLLLGLLGCNEPTSNDVAGSWIMTASSSRYLPAGLKGVSPSLLLHSDGSFSASDLPGRFHGSVGVVDRNSGNGRWQLVKREGRQQVQITFDGGYGTQLEVSGTPRSPRLFYFVGDPDQGRKIELTKR